MRPPSLELFDEMIKFGTDMRSFEPSGMVLEAWKQEYVLDAIGLSSPHPFWLLRAVTGDCENYKVARTAALEKPID